MRTWKCEACEAVFQNEAEIKFCQYCGGKLKEEILVEGVVEDAVVEEVVVEAAVMETIVDVDDEEAEEAFREEEVTEEIAIDETVEEEAVTENVVKEVVEELEEVIAEEGITEEIVIDESVEEEAVMGNAVEEAVEELEEVIAEEEITEETVIDESVVEDTVTENVVEEAVEETVEEITEEVNVVEVVSEEIEEDENIASWNEWDTLPVGHKQAMVMMSSLNNYVTNFKQNLDMAYNEEQTQKHRAEQSFKNSLDKSCQNCENLISQNNQQYGREIENTRARREKAQSLVSAGLGFVNNLPKEMKKRARQNVQNEMNLAVSMAQDVERAIDAKCDVYRKLRDLKNTEYQRRCNEEINIFTSDKNRRIEELDKQYDALKRSICNEYKSDIKRGFHKSAVHKYSKKVNELRFKTTPYECPSTVRQEILIGKIGYMVPVDDRDGIEVLHTLETQTSEVGIKEGGNYVIRMPYAQNLKEGISMLIQYERADRKFAHGLMEPLLMKLFMSLPAGKVEATMISPHDMAESFPSVRKLVSDQESARVIDTKIWSDEKEIENAIVTLRKKMEEISGAYSKDKESRLKKEAIRVLAITDFPAKFSNTALQDLHSIVRNCAELGVCVLICANNEELEKLKSNNNSLVTEIMNGMIGTVVKNQKLMLNGTNNMFIELDSMQDVYEKEDEIFTILRDAIEHARGNVEAFTDMFRNDIYDSNEWGKGNHDEIAVPIGIKGADTVVKMVLGRGGGSTSHHGLITGKTGSGKSTFLHTFIMSTLVSYKPEEVQLYLIDFKEGIEFNIYTQYRLPSVRVVAVNSEMDFGYNILCELVEEFNERSELFKKYDGVHGINQYNNLPGVKKKPKLILVFDEIQELLRDESEKSKEIVKMIGQLVSQGRSPGIHVLFASQDFNNCSQIQGAFSQMAIRIAIGDDLNSANSIFVDGNDVSGILKNRSAGAAVYNDGGGTRDHNNVFQIAYMKGDEQRDLLKKMHEYYCEPVVADKYRDFQTRVMLTNVESNINNCFNTLICNETNYLKRLAHEEENCGILLGQGFSIGKYEFVKDFKQDDNLLIIMRDELMALSICEMAILSILHEELCMGKRNDRTKINIVDFLSKNTNAEKCSLDYLKEQFDDQIEIVKKPNAVQMINTLYKRIIDLAESGETPKEKTLLVFMNIKHAVKNFNPSSLYENDMDSELSPAKMLSEIIIKGPKYGINSIVYSESPKGVENMFGNKYDKMFTKHIACHLDAATMENFVEEECAEEISEKTAVYMDDEDIRNTHFQPYVIPLKDWVADYAERYYEILEGEE